jgi:hypothetical protein
MGNMFEGFRGCVVQTWFATILCVVLALFFTWPYQLKGIPKRCNRVPYFGALFEITHQYRRLADWILEGFQGCGGKTFAVRLPMVGLLRGGAIFLTTPESVRHVLRDNFANYVKGENVRAGLSEFLGQGIFAADGAEWKFHRKVASHMFTTRLMRESAFVAARYTARLLAELRKRAGETIDMQARRSSHRPSSFPWSLALTPVLARARTCSSGRRWTSSRSSPLARTCAPSSGSSRTSSRSRSTRCSASPTIASSTRSGGSTARCSSRPPSAQSREEPRRGPAAAPAAPPAAAAPPLAARPSAANAGHQRLCAPRHPQSPPRRAFGGGLAPRP